MTTKIKRAKDLKIGDVIKGEGIVLKIELNPVADSFFDGPYYTCFDVNDSYYGPASARLDVKKKFEVYTDRKNINHYFKTIDCDINKYIADMLQYRIDLQKLHNKHIKKLNKKKGEKWGEK